MYILKSDSEVSKNRLQLRRGLLRFLKSDSNTQFLTPQVKQPDTSTKLWPFLVWLLTPAMCITCTILTRESDSWLQPKLVFNFDSKSNSETPNLYTSSRLQLSTPKPWLFGLFLETNKHENLFGLRFHCYVSLKRERDVLVPYYVHWE